MTILIIYIKTKSHYLITLIIRNLVKLINLGMAIRRDLIDEHNIVHKYDFNHYTVSINQF